MAPLTSLPKQIFVTSADLERQIEQLKSIGEARSGLFGPASVTWSAWHAKPYSFSGPVARCSCNSPTLGSPMPLRNTRAFSSTPLAGSITFGLTFTMMLGTRDQAIGVARRLHRRHAAIHGILPETIGPFPGGSGYRANEVAALQWVHASLIETSVIVHDLVLPPLTVEERECYYAENRLTAALFGIPPSSMPEHWSDFVAYKEGMVSSDVLIVSDAARAIAEQIIASQSSMRLPQWYRGFTAHLLPQRLHDAFGLDYGKDERRRAERIVCWLQYVYPRLPQSLRFVGPYHEAVRRLDGQEIPGFATQWLNLMWIGRRQLG